jgi:UDP-glucose-4-epimerase GalE
MRGLALGVVMTHGSLAHPLAGAARRLQGGRDILPPDGRRNAARFRRFTHASESMTVLVTGGAGYVGSHTVRQLLRRGTRVVVLDDLSHGHRASVDDGARLVVGDVGDAELVRRILRDEEVAAVIHLAADKSVEESLRDPGRYFRNNVGTTLTLLDACVDAGIQSFVFSSTCAVYGIPDELPVSEATPTQPEAPYGESKLIVERILAWYGRAHGLRSISLRYFNAAGAAVEGDIGEDWTDAVALIPMVMKAALGRSDAIRVYGTDYPTPDGTAIRDYIHVLDLADAHLRALDLLADGHPSAVLNLGTGRGASVREVIATTERIGGTSVPSIDAPRRPGDAPEVWAQADAARHVLDWSPRFGLDEIIETAWRWHSTHLDGYATAAGVAGEAGTDG